MAQSSRKAWCSVPGCSCGKQKQPYLSFHGFPSDPTKRLRWTAAIGRDRHRDPSFTARRGSAHVCSRHFAPEELYTSPAGRACLRAGAVPSRFAWNRWGEGEVEVGVEVGVGVGLAAGGLLVMMMMMIGDGDVGVMCEDEEEEDEAEEVVVPSVWTSAPDHDYAKPPTPPPAEDPAARIRALELRNRQLEARLQRLTLEMSRFWAADEERFGFHARFPDEEVFETFWESFPAAAGSNRAPYPSVRAQTHTAPVAATREAACQTESSGSLHIGTLNLRPSWRTKELRARTPSPDGQGVADAKPAKRRRRRQRRRHYDTDSSDSSSSSDAPLPDDVTDWNANSQSLWSGPNLHITDSTSSQVTGQADTWVEVTVKDEDEEEDIPWTAAGVGAGGCGQEETEEQKEGKPPVIASSAASPISDASARSRTPSPGPGSVSPREEVTVKKGKPRLWVNSGAP
ncbi:hypothetical protein CRUP_035429 [Coryphaenoides rupestris]|nr:hypothetical protein CRUP_035429 [Coryphaenoides rupestris]